MKTGKKDKVSSHEVFLISWDLNPTFRNRRFITQQLLNMVCIRIMVSIKGKS